MAEERHLTRSRFVGENLWDEDGEYHFTEFDEFRVACVCASHARGWKIRFHVLWSCESAVYSAESAVVIAVIIDDFCYLAGDAVLAQALGSIVTCGDYVGENRSCRSGVEVPGCL